MPDERSCRSPRRGVAARTTADRCARAPRLAPRQIVPLAASWAWLLTGCASYQLGHQALYRGDVRTVHVAIFESDSYRSHLGEWLTEAVAKEVELKTPYKVVDPSQADSVLTGRILAADKRVLAETATDLPRNIETSLVVQFMWQGPQGDLLHPLAAIPLPPVLQARQAANLIPEAGQSVASAQQRAVAQLATQIVAQMEMSW